MFEKLFGKASPEEITDADQLVSRALEDEALERIIREYEEKVRNLRNQIAMGDRTTGEDTNLLEQLAKAALDELENKGFAVSEEVLDSAAAKFAPNKEEEQDLAA